MEAELMGIVTTHERFPGKSALQLSAEPAHTTTGLVMKGQDKRFEIGKGVDRVILKVTDGKPYTVTLPIPTHEGQVLEILMQDDPGAGSYTVQSRDGSSLFVFDIARARTLVADGAGVFAETAAGSGQIGNPGGSDPGSSGITIVTVISASDFPDPVGGRIRTLEANHTYLVQGTVDIGNTELRCSAGVTIAGWGSGASTLSGSDNVLIEGSCSVVDITLSAPNGAAIVANTTGNLYLRAVLISGCQRACVVQDCDSMLFDTVSYINCTNGISLTGTVPLAVLTKVAGGGGGPTFRAFEVQATATVGPAVMENCQWTAVGPGAVCLEFASGASYTFTRVDKSNLDVQSGATGLGGVTKKDPRFFFRDNIGIEGSQYMGNYGFTGNTVETVISGVGAYVNIGAGAVGHPDKTANVNNERFEVTGTNPDEEVRYVGQAAIETMISYTLTTERVGGGTDIHAFRLMVNGVASTAPTAGGTVDIQGGSTATAARTVPFRLSPGDVLRVEIANGSDTSNIIVRDHALTVWRVG